MTNSSANAVSGDMHRNIDEEFVQLREIMESLSFRRSTGTAGEQAFYIYDYPASQELDVSEHVSLLKQQLQTMEPKQTDDYAPKVLLIDLYDVALGLLRKRGVLEKVLDIEVSRHKVMSSNSREDKFLALLDNMMGADTKHLPDAIRKIYETGKAEGNADIVFITGVGKVYPYIRAHTLLETLQGRIENCPLVLFYPGTFAKSSASGSTMTLFGCLQPDNYYRAKSLREMTPKL
jgi:hypothetical protein